MESRESICSDWAEGRWTWPIMMLGEEEVLKV